MSSPNLFKGAFMCGPFMRDTFFRAVEMPFVRTHYPEHATKRIMLPCARIKVGIGDSRPDDSNSAAAVRWVCAPAIRVHKTMFRTDFGLAFPFWLVQRSD